jgi:putative membrane protein
MRKTQLQQFLSEAEQEKITATVQQMEQQTSGEIVFMVVPQSHSYPVAMICGASSVSFICAIFLMPALGEVLWLGGQNAWVFIALFAVFYPLWHGLMERVNGLKRIFVTRRQSADEVRKAALTHFFTEQLYRTQDANGILLYVSLFERQAWILADSGINARIDQQQWQAVIDRVTEGIRKKNACAAICEEIVTIGDLLRTHFPRRDNDHNELRDAIFVSD